MLFAWSEGKGWQYNIEPNKNYRYQIPLHIEPGARNISVYPYDQSNFKFSIDQSHDTSYEKYLWNWNENYAMSQKDYDQNYYSYGVKNLKVSYSQYQSATGALQIAYEMNSISARNGQPYNVKSMLENGDKQKIYDLLDKPSEDLVKVMNLLESNPEQYGKDIQGYLFFLPIILKYEVLEATDEEYPEKEHGTKEDESDSKGTDTGKKPPIAVSDGNIIGYVYHTDQWNINRKKYNLTLFRDECNYSVNFEEYLSSSHPRKRGTNVFWSGEQFMLNAPVEGSPRRVTARISGYPSYQTRLSKTSKKDSEGRAIYEGSIWDQSMINLWGRNKPIVLSFIFTAEYPDGSEMRKTVRIIVDSKEDYWQLYRLF